jgi:ligand-binding sensor domain-containing protein
LGFSSTWAQDYKYYIYKVKNGLPTDIVKDVNQDEAGFVWIATDDGLVKFDGARFTTYKSALRSQFAKRLLKSRDGKLYAIGDLDFVEIQNQIDTVVFTTIRSGTRNPTDSMLWYPKSIYEDKRGDFWIGEPQAVSRISGESFRRYSFGKEDQSAEFARSFSFIEDQVGTLYTISHTGNVYALNTDGSAFEIRQKFPRGVNHILGTDGQLWIAASDGIYRATLLPEGGFGRPERMISVTSPSAITLIDEQLLLINTFNTDHYVFDIQTRTLTRFSIPLRDVNSVFRLHDELFISTSEGLVLLQQNLFHAVRSPLVENDFIESVTEDALHHDVYFATLESLFKVHEEGSVSVRPQRIDYRPGDSYQALIFHDGKLWASNEQRVLLYENDKISRQWNLDDKGRFIYDLAADDQGNIWISQDGSAEASYITPAFELRSVRIPLSGQSTLNAIRQTQRGLFALGGGRDAYLFARQPGDSAFVNVSAPIDFPIQSDLSVVDLVEMEDALYLASSEGLLRYTPQSL